MATDRLTLRLAQLHLGVSDLHVSEAFYRDVLHLETRREGETVVVRWPEFELILALRPPTPRAKFRVTFRVAQVADVDAWATRLRTSNIDIMSGPFDNGASRQLFFIDPDNYEIEICA